MNVAPFGTLNRNAHCAFQGVQRLQVVPQDAEHGQGPKPSLTRLVVHLSSPVLAVPLIVSRPISPRAALRLAETTARRFYGSRFVRVCAAA